MVKSTGNIPDIFEVNWALTAQSREGAPSPRIAALSAWGPANPVFALIAVDRGVGREWARHRGHPPPREAPDGLKMYL